MPSVGAARFLEKIGIRQFYKLIAGVGADKILSFDERPLIRRIKLVEMREDARYYAWANLFRGVLYVPVVLVMWPLDAWPVVYSLLILMVFHLMCITLEFYKGTVLDVWLPQIPIADEKLKEDGPTHADPHWYFSGKFFESLEGYRAIGMEWFRQLVVNYTNRTKYSKAELKAGKRVNYLQSGSIQSVVKYERDTRVGEIMHMTAMAFNVGPFVVMLQHQKWFWVVFVGLILWLDVYLVLLQRYNRIRVHRILAKSRKSRPTPTPNLAEQSQG